jgi:isopentenyl phosphate kinase
MKKLILIKLGGSVITDKTKEYSVREGQIKQLAEEVKAVSKAFDGKIILGHGAGSFAHVPAKKYQTKQGLINEDSVYGMAVTEDAARKLNSIVIKNFLEVGLPTFSFSPASFLISDVQVYSKSYLDPIKNALEVGILPVVYGDVIVDKTNGCTIFSTEKVLSIIARELQKDYQIRIIYCSDTDGVYDAEGITISEINSKNFEEVKKWISGSKSTDVTGGMINKVEESSKLAEETGIETVLINGNEKGNLEKAILGKEILSTRIKN